MFLTFRQQVLFVLCITLLVRPFLCYRWSWECEHCQVTMCCTRVTVFWTFLINKRRYTRTSAFDGYRDCILSWTQFSLNSTEKQLLIFGLMEQFHAWFFPICIDFWLFPTSVTETFCNVIQHPLGQVRAVIF